MTICWPITGLILSAATRAMMSLPPPAA